MGKSSKDKRDIYYRKAKEDGWRARSAYKLMQLDDVFRILHNVRHVIDLCAAPGSWSQVLSRRLYVPAVEAGTPAEELPKIVAIDLQPMAPIEGVTLLQGDITSRSTSERVISYFDGNQADLVISDGAPDVTGLHDLDEYVQSQLILAALVIVTATLKHGGTFVAKIFRGRDIGILYAQLKVLFRDVSVVKPKSSRNSSIEAFVVCRDFNPPSVVAGGMNSDALSCLLESKEYETMLREVELPAARQAVRFVACGDLQGYDSDASYTLPSDYERRDVLQSPVHGLFSHR
jgi:tRNA (cytidine32/guanosine34-2'-O)-methyltransferase